MTYFLTSDRLGFGHWTRNDQPLAALLWKDAAVMRYMGGPLDDQGVQSRLALEISRQERFGFQYWPVFLLDTGEHVGCSGLRPFHDEQGVLELGVHIAHKFWGARLGEEAARAVIQYGFRRIDAQAIVAGHGPHNDNSKALLLRLGFTFTHEESWGELNLLHSYYRMERPVPDVPSRSA
jgi:ribosomal-protein-alanine N-acetyltransferase